MNVYNFGINWGYRIQIPTFELYKVDKNNENNINAWMYKVYALKQS